MMYIARGLVAVGLAGLIVSGCLDDQWVYLLDDPDTRNTAVDTIDENDTGSLGPTDIDVDVDDDTDAVPPEGMVGACWDRTIYTAETEHLATTALDVFDDGAIVWATAEKESVSHLSWRDSEGEQTMYREFPGRLKEMRVRSDKGLVLIRRTEDAHHVEQLDADGDVAWTVTLPSRFEYDEIDFGGGGNSAYHIDVNASGDVILVGAFGDRITLATAGSEQTLTAAREGGFGAFIAKLNSHGELIFAKTLDAIIEPRAVALADDGSFYLMGNHPIEIYTGLYVAAFDTAGDVAWQTNDAQAVDETHGMNFANMVQSFVDAEGGLVIGGTVSSSVVLTDVAGEREELLAPIIPNPGGGTNMPGTYFIARYTPEGELVFAKSGFDGDTKNFLRIIDTPVALLSTGELAVVVKIIGTITLDVGGVETVLSEDEWPVARLTFELDGTVGSAQYLDIPAEHPRMMLAAGPDGSLIATLDYGTKDCPLCGGLDPEEPMDHMKAIRLMSLCRVI